jgi:hypothetical protein
MKKAILLFSIIRFPFIEIMAEYYEFTTVWRFDAPREKVWEQIKDSARWSE